MNLYTLQQRYRAGAARRGQGGFTMVELAIVLVIAGIILVAALKGTDMINKAKIERTVSDIRGIQGMIFEHEKRTGRLAGDCNGDGIIGNTKLSSVYLGAIGGTATSDAGSASSYDVVTDPTANGSGTYCKDTGTDEDNVNVAWKDLRKANIVDPTRSNQVLAKNQTNDFYGIGYLTMGATAGTSGGSTGGTKVNVITIHGIPLWMAKGIDVAIDGTTLVAAGDTKNDGGNLGRIRLLHNGTKATPDGDVWPTTNAGDDQIVSISYQFDRMAP